MLPDCFARDTLEHDKSTVALLTLLSDTIKKHEAHLFFKSTHSIGEFIFTVVSNDVKAGDLLTRCLVPSQKNVTFSSTLTVFVITGSSAPNILPPAWNFPHTDQRHLERLHLSPDGMVSAFYDHDRQFWMIVDKNSGRALLWIAEENAIPFWEEAAPFKQMLQWFFIDSGMSILHGGVVSNSRSGVLLAGAGGSGKSTTVAACFQMGLGVCGDDLVVVQHDQHRWTANAVYDAVKLSPNEKIDMPPILSTAPWSLCGEKRLVRYTDACRELFFRTTPLNALIHCTITKNEKSRLIPIAPSVMLRAIGPPTVFLLRGRESYILKEISNLVRTLPCFRLELGNNPNEAALLLKNWLDGLTHE